MARALELSLQDSFQVFLIDGKNFIPYNTNLIATSDLAAGIEGALIWPHTVRFRDAEGGSLKWATQNLFGEPWNRSLVPTGRTTRVSSAPPPVVT